MNYRKLGQSDITVSEIGLGCWTLGGLNWVNGIASGWSEVNEDEILSAVKAAVERGVNHFDNADVYGDGRAEQMLSRVFKKLGLKSEDYVIASKIGYDAGEYEHAYEAENIRRQCERSLKNLGRDYLDIYYLHHGDFGKGDEYLESAAEAMNALVDEGKVRVKGQSAYNFKQFNKAVPVVKPTVLQSWGHAMDTRFLDEGSPMVQLLESGHMSFVAFSPLNQGILLGKYDAASVPEFEYGDHRRTMSKFQAPFLEKVKAGLDQYMQRFGSDAESLAPVSLRFVLNHTHVASVIPGFRNESQVLCNLAAENCELSAQDMAFIRSIKFR